MAYIKILDQIGLHLDSILAAPRLKAYLRDRASSLMRSGFRLVRHLEVIGSDAWCFTTATQFIVTLHDILTHFGKDLNL